MKSAFFPILLAILVGTARANNDCLSDALKNFLASHTDLPTLPRLKEKVNYVRSEHQRVRMLEGQIKLVENNSAAQIKTLESEITKLKQRLVRAEGAGKTKTENWLSGQIKKREEAILLTKVNTTNTLEQMMKEVTGKKKNIRTVNNNFIVDAQKLLDQEGVPTLIFEKNEALMLEVNLIAPKTSSPSYGFYQRIKPKTDIKTMTISLEDNVFKSTYGYFQGGVVDRVELGYMEIFNILDGQVGQTAKHELRHAIFDNKRGLGIPSDYHVKFIRNRQGGIPLNKHEFYSDFMSTEEIYAWSTDLQTQAQKMKGLTPRFLLHEKNRLTEVLRKTDGLVVLSDTTLDIVSSATEKLNRMTKEKNFSEFNLAPPNEIYFADTKGRIVNVTSILPDNSNTKEIVRIQKEFQNALNANIEPKLIARGFTDLNSPEYIAAGKEYSNEFLKSKEAEVFFSKLNVAKEPLAEATKQQLNNLHLIGLAQKKEAEKLKKMLLAFLKPETGGKAQQLEDIKKQMFHVARNVKEGYKGSVINSAK